MAAHEHPSQSFRAESPARTVAIPTRLDIKTGLRIVLWRDIQQIFDSAKAVLNGGESVLFLTDDNFEYLTPLRIAHHPSVILEVVDANTTDNSAIHTRDQADGPVILAEASSKQSNTADCVSSLSTDGPEEETADVIGRAPPVFPDTTSDDGSNSRLESLPADTNDGSASGMGEPTPEGPCIQTSSETLNSPEESVSESCADVSVPLRDQSTSTSAGQIRRIIVSRSGSMVVYVSPSIQGYHQLYNSFVEAVRDGQAAEATIIADVMSELFERLQAELDDIRTIQERVERTQEEQRGVVETPQDVKELEQLDYSQHQEQSLSEQQQQSDGRQQMQPSPTLVQQRSSLDASPDIRDSILSVITQNYELHEYPFPRLFIVLPKDVQGADKIVKPTAKMFRLYFLCECGTHTMPKNCTTPPQVHLSKHQGYDIIRPAEFFQTYGRYVLAQMYMIKYGVKTTSLVVPSLENSGVADVLDTTQEHLDYIVKNMDSLVNESIRLLQDLTRNNMSDGIATDDESMRLDNIEVMDGVEQRQLKWYLRVDGKDRGFGNLHRIITSEHYVKWVCRDHDLANDQLVDAKVLQGLFNGESFMNDSREITLNGRSSVAWFQVGDRGYSHIPRVQKFRITTALQLDSLSGINSADYVDVAMDGYHDYTLYGEIAKLISNGGLQSLRLLSSYDHPCYSGSWHDIDEQAPMMRVFEYQVPLIMEDDIAMSYLGTFLGYCPNLVYLGLRLYNQVSLVKVMMTVIPKLKNLKRLELYYGKYYSSADITHGKIKTLRMHLPFTKHIIFKDTKIPEYSQVLNETLGVNQLVDILQECPSIDNVGFCYQELKIPDIITTFTNQPARAGCDGNTPPPRRLELVRVLDHKYPSSTTVSMEFGETGVDTEVRIGRMEKASSALYTKLFQHYGWSIRTLDAQHGIVDDTLALLLDRSTQEKGSRMLSLGLDMGSLSLTGLKYIDRVIRRSNGFEKLSITCTTSGIQHERENVQWFVEEHCTTLRGLTLHAHNLDDLTLWLEQVFPSRSTLSGLSDLQLALQGFQDLEVPHPYVQWLVDTISAPPPVTKVSPGRPDDAHESRESLRRFCLHGAKPKQDEWRIILEAIDFSVLKELDLQNTNFSAAELEVLADCIGRVGSPVPLEILELANTPLGRTSSPKSPFEGLREKGLIY
ncbi:hypothetical protein B0O80DRAFT_498329 [Mortierella sp. GBAus27b]|nr:hypothetical protein BGX31_000780 [Mortierella sp. GBA43]KAI8354316.1 hypothetical protein B0O80DRAFT_498329 [Mortierella sp. GBAus27b]